MLGLTRWRRKRLRNRPFPPAWLQVLERNVRFYRALPGVDQRELQQHILVFLAEKNFEGCRGQEITDEIRITIAAQACRLLLHRATDYYPGLYSILVYPSAFVAKSYQQLTPGFYLEGEEFRSGESWRHGAILLSWDEVEADVAAFNPGHNVVLHEFAHQLDTEDGKADGAPMLPKRSHYGAWARILGQDFVKLREDAAHARDTLLDYYGATNPAEFFAVATECFFEKPVEMRALHPELYQELRNYYCQDPASLELLEGDAQPCEHQ
jgi:Mlc titration factor MtfA (ptsG expression regulator)